MDLMYEIQQFDQPPAEIMKDIAPGLQFDSHGLPVTSLWGNGKEGGGPDMSTFGEGGGLPDLDLEKCVIM